MGDAGRVVAIWRYPVKSLMGEELNAADVTDRGVVGDRAYALLDVETGKAGSAKNPRRWPNLFSFRATFPEAPTPEAGIPPARIELPDGEVVRTDAADVDARLSAAIGRPVRLVRPSGVTVRSEGYWPGEFDFVEAPGRTFAFDLPDGLFFDGAVLHLLTTGMLDRLGAVAPASRFDVARFRPNLVIDTPDDPSGRFEDAWIGRTIAVGDVRLKVERPTPRCVMTTLPQGSLPKDPTILRVSVQENQGNVGVYASVERGGRVRRGDAVTLV